MAHHRQRTGHWQLLLPCKRAPIRWIAPLDSKGNQALKILDRD
jgi:hypothetical protein